MLKKKCVLVAVVALLCAFSTATSAADFNVAVSWYWGSDVTLHRDTDGDNIGMALTYPAAGLAAVPDVAYASSTGKLYAISLYTNQIKEFDAQTSVLERVFGGAGISSASGISAYGDYIYSANQGTNTVTRYSLVTGMQDMDYTVSVTNPLYISHDSSGNLYAGSSTAGGSKVFSADGTLLRGFAANPAGGYWTNVVADALGCVYGVGTGYPSSYLYRFNADGSIDTTFTRVALSDGAASPYGGKIGPDGKLYIAQTANDWAVTRYIITDTGGYWDNTFRAGRTDVNTYPSSMTFVPVPEPSTILALGGSLLGIASFSIRRKRQ